MKRQAKPFLPWKTQQKEATFKKKFRFEQKMPRGPECDETVFSLILKNLSLRKHLDNDKKY